MISDEYVNKIKRMLIDMNEEIFVRRKNQLKNEISCKIFNSGGNGWCFYLLSSVGQFRVLYCHPDKIEILSWGFNWSYDEFSLGLCEDCTDYYEDSSIEVIEKAFKDAVEIQIDAVLNYDVYSKQKEVKKHLAEMEKDFYGKI